MNLERNRLLSFKDPRWSEFNIHEMAANGLFAVGVDDIVRCEYCNLTMCNWDAQTHGQNCRIIHYKLSPDCPFINNVAQTFNVSLENHMRRKSQFEKILLQAPYYGMRRTLTHLVMEKSHSDDIGDREFAAAKALMILAQTSNLNRTTATSDSCDIPLDLSLTSSPKQPKQKHGLTATAAPTTSLTSPAVVAEHYYLVEETSTTRTYAIQYIQNAITAPKYPLLMSRLVRLNTFKKFTPPSITGQYTLQQIESMALAGLFYNSVKRAISCFYCGVSFKYVNFNNLQTNECEHAMVWQQHAIWSPWCNYVIVSRGYDFIRLANATLADNVRGRAQALYVFD